MAYAVKVLDADMNFRAYINQFASGIMERKLYEVGRMELHIPYGANGANQIERGCILYIDPATPYIVTGRSISEAKKGVELVIYGIQLKGILGQRLTLPDRRNDELTFGYDRYPEPSAPEAPAETVMKYYVNKHVVNPSDINRKIHQITLAADQGRGMPIRWSSRFENLDTLFKTIGEYTGMGYDMALDISSGKYVFDVISGVDRTVNSKNPVVFSIKFHNVLSTKYTDDDKNHVNAAYAGGAGDGEGRLIQAVFTQPNTPAGLDRRESFLDCGSVDTYDSLIFEAEYKLKDKTIEETLSGETSNTGPFRYRIDYDIGDTVTAQSMAAGLERDTQVTEANETYEKGDRKITLTFGKRQSTILDKIRKTEAIR